MNEIGIDTRRTVEQEESEQFGFNAEETKRFNNGEEILFFKAGIVIHKDGSEETTVYYRHPSLPSIPLSPIGI